MSSEQAPRTVGDSGRPAVSSTLRLVVGTVFLFMTFMRYSLPEIGWLAFSPFLADGAPRPRRNVDRE